MKVFKQAVRTISLDEIEEMLKNMQITHIIDAIQEGFAAYSSGSVVVPPVGEMLFEDPPGETHIKYGTHITAMGSDTPHKIELDPAILQKADIIAVDSIEQSLSRGEIFQARQAGALAENSVVELGNIIAGTSSGRTSDGQISVADLTGVAIQDIQICKLVSRAI